MHTKRAMSGFRWFLWVALALSCVACGWKAEPAQTQQTLSGDTCEGEPVWIAGVFGGVETPLVHQCGDKFPAKIWGECNDCDDRGCTQANEGAYECACYSLGEVCTTVDDTMDTGCPSGTAGCPSGTTKTVCHPWPEDCECNDGKGRIYQCECEGGGDDCGCRVPHDFRYDLECEAGT